MPAAPEATAGAEPVAESAARTVWALAWPAVTLNSLQTVNALLDSYFVQHLPVANLVAIGASTSVLFLFVSMAMALGTAATAFVSRAYGANDVGGYVTANQKCLGLSLVGGLAFAAFSYPFSWAISYFVLSPQAAEARPLMLTYLGIFALGLPAFFIIQSLAGALRGIGDTKSPMVISGIQIVLHILLNTVLINEPKRLANGIVLPGLSWGLTGAAIALVVSGWVAAVVYMVWAGRTPLGSCLRCSWPGWDWAKRILKVAVPAATMSVVRVTSLLAFTAILARVPNGEAAVAALRPAFSIESLAFMPGFGLSIAAAALVGQSLGMKRPDRAEKLGWTAAHHAALVGLGMSVILFTFAPQVAGWVMPDQPLVAQQVTDFLKFICVTEFMFGYGMVFIGALQGAGDTVRPLLATVFCMWGLRVPLAGLFAFALSMGTFGCWLSMSLTQAIQGIVAIWMFKRGAWKTQTV